MLEEGLVCFALPSPASDEHPCVLAPNLRSVGMLWQEWEYGIAGAKPAKLWSKEERSSNSMFSRRKPIYLILDRLINVKKKLPAEAFRMLEDHFPRCTMTKMADEIRARELNGTLHEDLVAQHHRLDLQAPRKRRRTNGSSRNSRNN